MSLIYKIISLNYISGCYIFYDVKMGSCNIKNLDILTKHFLPYEKNLGSNKS